MVPAPDRDIAGTLGGATPPHMPQAEQQAEQYQEVYTETSTLRLEMQLAEKKLAIRNERCPPHEAAHGTRVRCRVGE